MIRPRRSRWCVPTGVVGLVLAAVAAPCSAAQSPPEELRGRIAAVTSNRIRIALDQQEWLPPAGVPVAFGEELAGMFVPLKGAFVIVQVNETSADAMVSGTADHGTPAPGMLAVIKTPYPNRPQRRSDYVAARDRDAVVLPMAEGGNALAQHTLAMGYASRGDHDVALAWWDRASTGAADRGLISLVASGRARILAVRSDHKTALAVLTEAAQRTAPRNDERVFGAYSTGSGADAARAVESHVSLLQDLGHYHRRWLDDRNEAARWFRGAADVMTAAATNGAPGPEHQAYRAYLRLVMNLADLYLLALEDESAAVPWLQIAARAGETRAQEMLTRLGRRW